jgi:hypothetical protein
VEARGQLIARGRDPVVVVCAWCDHYGRAHGAARAPQSRHWRAVSHEYVRAQKRAGAASHGVCTACRALVAQEWGMDAPPRVPLSA